MTIQKNNIMKNLILITLVSIFALSLVGCRKHIGKVVYVERLNNGYKIHLDSLCYRIGHHIERMYTDTLFNIICKDMIEQRLNDSTNKPTLMIWENGNLCGGCSDYKNLEEFVRITNRANEEADNFISKILITGIFGSGLTGVRELKCIRDSCTKKRFLIAERAFSNDTIPFD